MLKPLRSWAAIPLGLTLLVTPARARNDAPQGQAADPHATTAPENATHKPATDDPNYVIGPQDVLDINVWKEPDISRSVPVRPDGKISLPLLNDVQAGADSWATYSTNLHESE